MAKEPTVPKDIAGLSFEDALKELEGIVQQLERGQVKLDEAITAYERGALLKRHCEQKLAEAKMKVEKIVFLRRRHGQQPARRPRLTYDQVSCRCRLTDDSMPPWPLPPIRSSAPWIACCPGATLARRA